MELCLRESKLTSECKKQVVNDLYIWWHSCILISFGSTDMSNVQENRESPSTADAALNCPPTDLQVLQQQRASEMPPGMVDTQASAQFHGLRQAEAAQSQPQLQASEGSSQVRSHRSAAHPVRIY
jgi:hypothetical protein